MDIDMHYLARLLQSCNGRSSLQQGRQVHLLFLKKGLLGSALSVGNRLLQMYGRCGSMTDARQLFEEMPERNCFSWNTMIEGYLRSGERQKSLEIFNAMPDKNDFSWDVILSGFVKMGEIEIARILFNDMPRKNGVAWNLMIHGYVRNGHSKEALLLFRKMCLDPLEVSGGDSFVFATVVGACAEIRALDWGKQIHARIVINGVEFDSVLASSLVNMYGKSGDLDSAKHVLNAMDGPTDFSESALIAGYACCGRIYDARKIFDSKRNPCIVLWNSIISAYVSNGGELEALSLFNNMRNSGVNVDSSTLASVLSASSGLGFLEQSRQLHTLACKVGLIDDVVVASALIDAYYKCGSCNDACRLFSGIRVHDTILLNTMITIYCNSGRIEDAKQIFKRMPSKSLVTWNSMIAGLSQNGCPIEAIYLLCDMNKLGLKMDEFSMASVISACGCIPSLELGEQVFARAIGTGLGFDPIIATSLVDFYCKCGLVENSRKIFDGMVKSDEVPWNSMLMGYATNGYRMEALSLFNEMREAGFRPNDITFTGVLSVCDHCGLVEEGRKWFDIMKLGYHIDPGLEHYSCMVDLYSRAGYLREALSLIEEMPFAADISMLSSVLRGCVAHGVKDVGIRVAEQIIERDPENSGAHIQLAGMLANLGDWEGSEKIRQVMRERKIQKSPGHSWADCWKESMLAA